MIKKTIPFIILAALLICAGCASTHRLDGGRFDVYGNDPETGEANGKLLEILRFDLLGAMFRAIPFSMRSGLAVATDEPTAAAGYSALSKTAAEKLSAESTRGTNGTKTVRYGAHGLTTDAQELAEILAEAERLKNNLPGRPEPEEEDEETPAEPEPSEDPEPEDPTPGE